LLLRKQEALSISNHFPNIWRKIHSTSFHNLVSLKKVTYKILRQYYNSHFYIKNKKEDNLKFNLDASTSYISMIDNYFHNKAHKSEKHSKKNIVKSIKKDGFNNSFNVKQKRQSSIQLLNDIKIKHNSSFGSGLSSFRGVSKFHHKNSHKFNSEKFTRPREK
jgi:hypothetical protein